MKTFEMTIPSIKANIKKQEKKIASLEGYFSDISTAKERIERVAGEVEKIQRKFPLEIDDSFYIKSIKEFAISLNMKKTELSSGGEVDKGFFFVKRFEFSARGTYLQFLIFLEKIENFEKLLNISNVSFNEIPEKQKGRFQLIEGKISIEAYRYDQSHKEDRGIDGIEKDFALKNKKRKKGKKK